MQRTVDKGFGYNKLNTSDLEDQYNALDEHSKITMNTCKGMGKSVLLSIVVGLGFQADDYDDICVLIDGGSLNTTKDLLCSIDVDELILSQEKPDILRKYDVLWPRTAKAIPSEEVKQRRRVVVCACLEKPGGVPAGIVNNALTKYKGFVKNIENLQKDFNGNKKIKTFKDRYNTKYYDIYHRPTRKRDDNKSKKFDAALHQIRDTTITISNIQIDTNKLVGDLQSYIVTKLQIAKFKKKAIHPRTTTIKQHNSAQIITTEISPSLWNIYSKLLTNLVNIKNECNEWMQNINFIMSDMRKHKYITGKRGKTVEQRIAMDKKRKDKHKKNEQQRYEKKGGGKKKKMKEAKKDKQPKTRKDKTKDKVKSKNIMDMFRKNKPRPRNELFMYIPVPGQPISISEAPVYHKTVVFRYQRSLSLRVPTWITLWIIGYLCDNACYKCKVIPSQDKNNKVDICGGKCLKFICEDCVVNREGISGNFYCDMHQK